MKELKSIRLERKDIKFFIGAALMLGGILSAKHLAVLILLGCILVF